MTPRLLKVHFDAAARRLKREHEDRAWLAWTTSRLTHADPRRFPKLSELTGSAGPAKRQSWQQQLAILQTMTADAAAQAEAAERRRAKAT